MNIIETESLYYKYDDGSYALSDVSIGFEKGRITTILGANGAGKSTLFLNLNGILKPESGTVKFMGESIKYTRSEIKNLRRSVGIVFQDPDDQLFSASVFQDVSFGAMNMKLPEDEVMRRVNDALERTGIAHLKDNPTHALSFGQKKRAAIAGILVMKPEVIILDEPTAGLDPMGVSSLMHLLKDICQNEGTTIIMSTHDIDVVPIYSDYIYVLDRGRLLTRGTSSEVFKNPDILREHNLRLPRISHLLEILNKCDNLETDFSKATIGGAREEILNLIRSK
ncbi:MAG: ATP-binding cassette domain-containing protein [Firmicutes bacterium]|nr:ATP-binding cassette domain-containing protein [Bacillota bacterium]